MDVELLTGERVEQALARLIDDHDAFHWVVAWGTGNPLTARLLSHRAKFKAVTFGLAFAQTDPDLVDALVDVPGAYVVAEFPGGTYHPKVYAFRSGSRAVAIVGSANFTNGGLGRNHEASVLITGSADDPVLADILAFAARSAKLGEHVTVDLARRYRLSHRLAMNKPRPSRDPLAQVPHASVKGLSSPLVDMSWQQYARTVRASDVHNVEKRLNVLRTAQAWLASVPSFRDLDAPQRKALAGTIGDRDKVGDELSQDWAWFGSMRGAGVFANRVAENDQFLADAVDSIPQKGEVTREHFDRFAGLFTKAFENSQRVGRVPTASRLLAMKRPDVFLCISNPNRALAAREMGFAESGLKLENYWDRVVEVIRASKWYNVDKPVTRDGQLWEYRAAMLDAWFYQPE